MLPINWERVNAERGGGEGEKIVLLVNTNIDIEWLLSATLEEAWHAVCENQCRGKKKRKFL